MVEADVIEVMVALPSQLFFNTQIPACLWFLVKQKTKRKGEVLFIDARKMATMISKVQSELTDSAIHKIEETVTAWRGEGGEYQDVAGFCRSVELSEIAKHGNVLTPGRYVGAQEVEDDEEAFSEKMEKLSKRLSIQIDEGIELDLMIRNQLRKLGYAA